MEVVRQRSQKGQGDSIVHISSASLSTIVVMLPPLPEQTAIAEILTAADSKIERLNRELQQQRLLKKYLMQQLLTGRKRVVKGLNDVFSNQPLFLIENGK
jgi:type I restriction enzyme S subunit